MHTRFAGGSGKELASLIRELSAKPEIKGLLVLSAEEDNLNKERLDPVLQDVSTPVFGGVFPEILSEGDRYTNGTVVVGLAVEPTVTVIPELSDPGTEIIPRLEGKVSGTEVTTFVFVDAFIAGMRSFIERLFQCFGVEHTLVGGGAGSLSMEQAPCLITNNGIMEDAAVIASIEVPSHLGVNHGWEVVDGPFRINDADGSKLSMLGDESAFSVYRRVIGDDLGATLTRNNFFDLAKSYPFGISRLHGEHIVRDPFKVHEDGSLTCFGEVSEGEYLHVLSGDSVSLVEAAADAADTAIGGGGEGGPLLSFDCISRALFLEDDFSEELAAIGGPNDPLFGALPLGEIANGDRGHLEFYNKTVVAAQIQGI